ncbi:hypothetical protein JN531_004570 [Flagellatimonas centrodinii]|uniref:hypothetical protein n=1 Tax=Flagellatimonas centrodinii TaxID=2806210 RepID=UPI001FED9DC2|nr:hypothetical protein [Flagellatimonas centrodinii]ULQ47561.1 hypothetical protein JN531_004570 [Flagellatimonas centrodinii]
MGQHVAVACGSVLFLVACGGSPLAGPDQGGGPVASLTDGEWLAGDLHVHS